MDLYTAVMPDYKKQEIQKLNIDIAPSDLVNGHKFMALH